jgi:AcrR family transcriptional regulator
LNGLYRNKARKLREDVILDAAEAILSTEGCSKLSTAQVASLVGIGKATVYLHFQTQNDLIEATLSRAGKELLEVLASTKGESPEQSLREAIDRIIKRLEDSSPDHLVGPCCFQTSPCRFQSWQKIEARLKNMVDNWRNSKPRVGSVDFDFAIRVLQHLLVAVMMHPTAGKREQRAILLRVRSGYFNLLGLPER